MPVAACLNFDARSEEAAPLCAQSAFSRSQPLDQKKEEEDEAKKSSDSSLTVVDFLQEVEEPFKMNYLLPNNCDRHHYHNHYQVEEPLKREHLPPGKGKFIYTSLLGTAAHLTTSENIKVVSISGLCQVFMKV